MRKIVAFGRSMLLEPQAAQTIAMCVHELATNAAKYGALSLPEGHVQIDWDTVGERLILRWTESGGPPVAAPKRHGFGTRVIEGLICAQKGEIHFDWRREGLACEIIMPT